MAQLAQSLHSMDEQHSDRSYIFSEHYRQDLGDFLSQPLYSVSYQLLYFIQQLVNKPAKSVHAKSCILLTD